MASWHNRPKIQISKVDDATIPARLDAIIGNPAVSAGDKSFCESLKQGWNKYKSLTAGQYGALQKCELRYDANTIAANSEEVKKRQEWVANFSNEMRATLNTCADYYSKTPYFRDLAQKVLAEPLFTPSEKQYRAMCENKYAQRLMENITNPAKFKVGDIVSVRETTKRVIWSETKEMPHIILEITEQVRPLRGSRLYTLLPIGHTEKVQYEEKSLKIYRENTKQKGKNENSDDNIPF